MIYRVHYYDKMEGSSGFEYFGDKMVAEKAMKEVSPHHNPKNSMGSFKTPKSKEEIIDILNAYGDHADNG